MYEILNKRTYNSKVFDYNGEKKAQFHAGHIHYKDGEEYKDIDHSLLFDEVKRGWYFLTHSYNPFLPEYSNQWAEFRDRFQGKDQTIKYRIDHETGVKGELIENDPTNPNFDDNKYGKAALYKNAFGENRDYILYNTKSSLVKVATVNNPNEQTEDAVFEWEIELPEKEVFRVEKKEDAEEMTAKATKTNTEDGKLVGYRLKKENAKNFNTKKLTLIGDSKLDGQEWFTYLKSYKAWDSEGNTIDIEARIEFRDGKTYLKKTIPVEFLQSAVGRVFADTTTSYYDITNKDNLLLDSNPTTNYGTLTSAQLCRGDTRLGRWITEISIPSGTGTISSIKAFWYVWLSNNSPSIDIHEVTQDWIESQATWNQHSSGNNWASAGGDYDATVIDTISVSSINQWYSFELIEPGASGVGLSLDWGDTVKLLTKESSEQTSTDRRTYAYSKENTTNDPYLEITYTEGATYTLSMSKGTFSLTGKVASFLIGYVLAAATGVFTLSGKVAEFIRTYVIAATTGVFSLSGKVADLIWSGAATYVMAASTGVFTLSGKVASLTIMYILLAAKGTFTLSGKVVSFIRTYVIAAAKGTFTLLGKIATLRIPGRWNNIMKTVATWSNNTKSASTWTNKDKS